MSKEVRKNFKMLDEDFALKASMSKNAINTMGLDLYVN